MANKTYTAQYEALPLIAKIISQVVLGAFVGGVYRIVRYFETKNTVTLIVGIIVTFTGIGNFISWVVDLISEILYNKIAFLAD